MRYLFQKSRPLSPIETTEGIKVFGNSIDFKKIKIIENSFVSHVGKIFARKKHLGVCTLNTIHFSRKINCAAGNMDMAWLMHEYTHVWQYKKLGLQYIPLALYAQHFTKDKYHYTIESLSGKNLYDFNLEQQAEIIKDYYLGLYTNQNASHTATIKAMINNELV